MGGAALRRNAELEPRSPSHSLRPKKGRDLLRELAARADILLENFAPGVMDRLGLGAADLPEDQSATDLWLELGLREIRSLSRLPAMDLVMQAMCGVINSTAIRISRRSSPARRCADFSAGIHLYAAIMTALYERERTGKGRRGGSFDADATYASPPRISVCCRARRRRSGAHRQPGMWAGPSRPTTLSDHGRYVVLNAPSDHHFRSILDVMGRSDLKEDPRFLTRATRVAISPPLMRVDRGQTKTLTKDEVARRIWRRRCPCAPRARFSEVMHDENMHARGSCNGSSIRRSGALVLPHSPLVFEGTNAGRSSRACARRQQRRRLWRLARPFGR